MQNLAAVLECTSRSLLPPKYKDMGPRRSDPPGEGTRAAEP